MPDDFTLEQRAAGLTPEQDAQYQTEQPSQTAIAPQAPPPVWRDVKNDPAFQSLTPDQQLGAFNRWHTHTSDYLSKQPDWNENSAEFNKKADETRNELGQRATAAALGLNPDATTDLFHKGVLTHITTPEEANYRAAVQKMQKDPTAQLPPDLQKAYNDGPPTVADNELAADRARIATAKDSPAMLVALAHGIGQGAIGLGAGKLAQAGVRQAAAPMLAKFGTWLAERAAAGAALSAAAAPEEAAVTAPAEAGSPLLHGAAFGILEALTFLGGMVLSNKVLEKGEEALAPESDTVRQVMADVAMHPIANTAGSFIPFSPDAYRTIGAYRAFANSPEGVSKALMALRQDALRTGIGAAGITAAQPAIDAAINHIGQLAGMTPTQIQMPGMKDFLTNWALAFATGRGLLHKAGTNVDPAKAITDWRNESIREAKTPEEAQVLFDNKLTDAKLIRQQVQNALAAGDHESANAWLDTYKRALQREAQPPAAEPIKAGAEIPPIQKLSDEELQARLNNAHERALQNPTEDNIKVVQGLKAESDRRAAAPAAPAVEPAAAAPAAEAPKGQTPEDIERGRVDQNVRNIAEKIYLGALDKDTEGPAINKSARVESAIAQERRLVQTKTTDPEILQAYAEAHRLASHQVEAEMGQMAPEGRPHKFVDQGPAPNLYRRVAPQPRKVGTAEREEALPEPPPGERIVNIQRPDGSTYQASFGDKNWNFGGHKVPMVGRPIEGRWSHGMLAPEEKIVEQAPVQIGAAQRAESAKTKLAATEKTTRDEIEDKFFGPKGIFYQIQKTHFDPENPKEYKKAIAKAVKDIEGYVKENPHLQEYYNQDMTTLRAIMDKNLPRPLTDDEFKVVQFALGATSPNTMLSTNVLYALKIGEAFQREGNLGSVVSGAKGIKQPEGKIGLLPNHAAMLKLLDKKIYEMSSVKNALNWFQEPVDRAGLNAVHREAGYGDISPATWKAVQHTTEAATGQKDLVPRMFAFGNKAGAYTLNHLGDFRYNTTDKWESRFIRSYFPSMFEKATGIPLASEHEMFARFGKDFKDAWEKKYGPTDNAGLQALRWYYVLTKSRELGYPYARTSETISKYAEKHYTPSSGALGRQLGAGETEASGQTTLKLPTGEPAGAAGAGIGAGERAESGAVGAEDKAAEARVKETIENYIGVLRENHPLYAGLKVTADTKGKTFWVNDDPADPHIYFNPTGVEDEMARQHAAGNDADIWFRAGLQEEIEHKLVGFKAGEAQPKGAELVKAAPDLAKKVADNYLPPGPNHDDRVEKMLSTPDGHTLLAYEAVHDVALGIHRGVTRREFFTRAPKSLYEMAMRYSAQLAKRASSIADKTKLPDWGQSKVDTALDFLKAADDAYEKRFGERPPEDLQYSKAAQVSLHGAAAGAQEKEFHLRAKTFQPPRNELESKFTYTPPKEIGTAQREEQEPAMINIGLNVNDGSKITPEEVNAELKKLNVGALDTKIHQSGTEPTFTAHLTRPLTPDEAHQLSVNLKQEAIAQYHNGAGELYGPGAEKWRPFNSDYFITPEGKDLSYEIAGKTLAAGEAARKLPIYKALDNADTAAEQGGMLNELARLLEKNPKAGWERVAPALRRAAVSLDKTMLSPEGRAPLATALGQTESPEVFADTLRRIAEAREATGRFAGENMKEPEKGNSWMQVAQALREAADSIDSPNIKHVDFTKVGTASREDDEHADNMRLLGLAPSAKAQITPPGSGMRVMTRENRMPGQITPATARSKEEMRALGAQQADTAPARMANLERTGQMAGEEDMAAFNAYTERLSKEADQTGDRTAEKAWRQRLAPYQARWSEAGLAQQEETNLDTPQGMQRAFEKQYKKDMTPEQQAKAAPLVEKNKASADELAKVTGDLTKAISRKSNQLPTDPAALREHFAQRKTEGGPGSKFIGVATRAQPLKFTQDEIQRIWETGKTFIDNSTTIDDLSRAASDTAAVLGLTPDEVRAAWAQPKRANKPVADDLYRAMNNRRAALDQSRSWLDRANMTGFEKFWRDLLDFPRTLAVLGHANPLITHAGRNIFTPYTWNNWGDSFVKQFKFLVDPAAHELAMQKIMEDPMFQEARRAGLRVSPNDLEDYSRYNKVLGQALGSRAAALGRAGNRAMDALKVFRMEMFKQHMKQYADLPVGSAERQSAAEQMATLTNHISGYSNNAVTRAMRDVGFAPGLEGSRWAFIGDYKNALKTAARMATGQAVSAGDVAATKLVASRAAQFTGSIMAALLANQALLKATGQKEEVNYTDPAQADFLRFKWGGRTLDFTGGVMQPARLLARLLAISQMDKGNKQSAFGTEIYNYALGKANPGITAAIELATGQDYAGKALPGRTPSSAKKGQYTVPEYALTKAPIPLSETAKTIYDQLAEGTSPDIAKQIMSSLTALGFGVLGAKQGNEPTKEWEPKAY